MPADAEKVTRIKVHFGSYTGGSRGRSKITIAAKCAARHSSRPGYPNQEVFDLSPPSFRGLFPLNPDFVSTPPEQGRLYLAESGPALHLFLTFVGKIQKSTNLPPPLTPSPRKKPPLSQKRERGRAPPPCTKAKRGLASATYTQTKNKITRAHAEAACRD